MKTIKYTLLSILSIFLCFEIFFRMVYYEELKENFFPLIYKTDTMVGTRYIPNKIGAMCRPGIPFKTFKINNMGYTGPDFYEKKADGIFRVIIIGASGSNVIWSPGNRDYTSYLQQLLKHNKIEVINCSLEGENRQRKYLKLINNEIINYRPDLVIAERAFPFAANDLVQDTYKDFQLEYDGSPEGRINAINRYNKIKDMYIFNFFYKLSYVVRATYRFFSTNFDNAKMRRMYTDFHDKKIRCYDCQYYTYTVGKTLSLMKETNNLLNDRGASLVFLNYGKNEEIDSIFTANALRTISLNCEFDNSFYSLPDNHLNEKGHKVIADSLYKALVKNNYIRL